MRITRLGAVAGPNGLIGGPFGSSLVSSDYSSEGVPVIRGANLSSGRFVGGDYAYVPVEKYERDLTRNTAEPGDIVYTQRGTLGQVAIVPRGEHASYIVSQSQMRLRVDQSVADPTYIYYATSSADFVRQVYDRAISTGVPHINLGILADLTVPLPPLATQRAIAEALGALDDKIEANRKLAATAAQLTRSIYRWALSLPGKRRGRFFDYFTVEYGTAYKGAFFTECGEGRPLIRVRDLKTYSPQTWTTEVVSGEASVQPGDILVGMDADFSPTAWQGETALLNQRVCRVASDYSRAFTLEAVRAPLQHIEGYKTGTTVIHLNKRDLTETHVELPSHEAARAFDNRASALLEEQTAVFAENRTLVALRDTMLPKLMSGQLRVEEVREAISA